VGEIRKMATATEVKRPGERSGSWQVSLADLIFMVLAAGLAAGIARGARHVWGTRPAPSNGLSPVPNERTAGLAMEIAAVWLAMILARGIIVLVRGEPSGGDAGRLRRVIPIAWRAAAIVLLLSLAMGQSGILRVNPSAFDNRLSEVFGETRYHLREALLPICTILASIGLALGAGAGVVFARPNRQRPRPYWLFVPLAALASVLFLGNPDGWWGLISHLVLVALEAVSNAMPPPAARLSGSLSTRLLLAGIEAVPAAVACLGLAMVVARDFERARRAEPWATARGGWILRILLLVTAASAGTLAAFVAVPTVQPHWFDGFRKVLEPDVIAIILAGFGALSAGLAARTLVPASVGERPTWQRRLSATVPLVLPTILLLSALNHFPSAAQIEPNVPTGVGRFCDWVGRVNAWLWSWVPDPVVAQLTGWLEPDRLAWTLSMGLVALLVVELSLSRAGRTHPVPFDAVAGAPGLPVRFLWLTGALTTVCVASLPILAVLGQAIIDIRFHIDRWMIEGWPSPF
jgi:hypothetical protein